MASDPDKAGGWFGKLLESGSVEELRQRLAPKDSPHPPTVPGGDRTIESRWEILPDQTQAKLALEADRCAKEDDLYAHNIENLIGTIRIPVGLAGPLRVNGTWAQGDYYVPLATTEAALVASYHRGMRLVSAAGGCASALLSEGVIRAPGFVFKDIADAGVFAGWASQNIAKFREAAEATTRHGKLEALKLVMESNAVYLLFEYTTGDASGQNMVTIATEAAYQFILENTPVKPRYSFLEANMSGDKKASAYSFVHVRGKKVTAQATLPAKLVQRVLHTSVERMVDYWRVSALGGVMSGTIGVQGHYANGLAAIYLATGQDVACVAESAVGVTKFEQDEEGALVASVTLPSLMVGTVGGGTGLPSQKACLDILGLAGAGKARAFAEVCAGTVLAGELSIIGSLAAGHFAQAHRRLARGV